MKASGFKDRDVGHADYKLRICEVPKTLVQREPCKAFVARFSSSTVAKHDFGFGDDFHFNRRGEFFISSVE
jgi:hypothetical protein